MATLKQLVDQITVIKNDIRTCHTNLKNNLIDKGVEVSASDKLPILINKVANMSNIDIVVKNSLPSSVKNGQIVVVSNHVPSKILFDTHDATTGSEGDLFVKILSDRTGHIFKIGNNSVNASFNIFGVRIYRSGLWVPINSYLGVSGKWVSMNSVYIVDSVNKLNITNAFNNYMTNSYFFRYESLNNITPHMYTIDRSDSNDQTFHITTKQTYSFTAFKQLVVKCRTMQTYGNSSNKFNLIVTSADGNTIISKVSFNPNSFNLAENTFTLDLSSINVEGKVRFELFSRTNEAHVYIDEAYLS